MDISGFLSSLSPETRDALIKTGLGGIGSYYQGKAAEGKQRMDSGTNMVTDANRNALDTRQNAAARRGTDIENRTSQSSQDFQNKNAQIDAADRLTMQAMGTSPLQFAAERGNMAAKAEIMSKAMVPNYLRGQVPAFMANGLSPSTIQMMTPTAGKEQGYWDAVAMGSKGRFQGPNLGASYGGAGSAVDDAIRGTSKKSGDLFSDAWGGYEQGRDNQWNAYESDRNTRLDEMVGVSDKQKTEAVAFMNGVDELAKKEGQGSKWHILGNIIKLVGPVAAIALSGGALAPVVATAMAAGSSAAGTKLAGGSWKDAAISGGLSAASASMLGGAGKGLNAGKQVASVQNRIYPT